MGSSTTEYMTPSELTEELRRLEAELGMAVDLAEHLAAADALDADLYQVLRRIRDLRWLQTA
jgi:enolase